METAFGDVVDGPAVGVTYLAVGGSAGAVVGAAVDVFGVGGVVDGAAVGVTDMMIG